jgi:hypothetical protein
MNVAAALVADEQAFELMEPGEGALDDPAVAAEPGAVHALAPGDLRCDAALAKLAAPTVVVVAAVGSDTRRPPPRPADLAAHRRHPVEERDRLGAVVAVAARERPGERDPGRVDQEMMLGAVSTSPHNSSETIHGATAIGPSSLTTDTDGIRHQGPGPFITKGALRGATVQRVRPQTADF